MPAPARVNPAVPVEAGEGKVWGGSEPSLQKNIPDLLLILLKLNKEGPSGGTCQGPEPYQGNMRKLILPTGSNNQHPELSPFISQRSQKFLRKTWGF